MKTINKERFINNTINVNNEMPFNTNVSDNDLLIYVLAKKNKGFNMCSVCNINYLYDLAEFNNKKYIKQIKDSLSNLSDLGYVGLYDLQYNEISIDTVKPSDNFIIYFGEDGFASEKRVVNGEYFPTEYWYLDNVMNASKNVNARCKFIRYSLIVRRLLNYDSEVNYIAHSLVDKFISNRDTVSNYNNILSDLGLIHFNNDYVSKSTGKNSSTYIAFKHELAGNKVTLSTFNKILSDIAEKDGLVIQSKEEQGNKRKRKAKTTDDVVSDVWGTTFEDCEEDVCVDLVEEVMVDGKSPSTLSIDFASLSYAEKVNYINNATCLADLEIIDYGFDLSPILQVTYDNKIKSFSVDIAPVSSDNIQLNNSATDTVEANTSQNTRENVIYLADEDLTPTLEEKWMEEINLLSDAYVEVEEYLDKKGFIDGMGDLDIAIWQVQGVYEDVCEIANEVYSAKCKEIEYDKDEVENMMTYLRQA
ncbi:hypothetical protein [Cellulosilyticum lentocellum]|uniref:Uncharacterized protein n=1 Tax=Cellulosilyticum lentocellum (strain ATCC 49066 / DSM 5427 / NCIMB 11756 / RHM5) TaxID=642492 RepID=F2JSR9_CELLD|nr:hypothetical protein [Cellulosilyticum lentocellum]ADZ82903.1 hypothetical protein Clole_1174 [Cellulosilyticum lentocellum DSM 5427]